MRNTCQICCELVELCIVGPDEFAAILKVIRDKRRRLRKPPEPEPLRRQTDSEDQRLEEAFA